MKKHYFGKKRISNCWLFVFYIWLIHPGRIVFKLYHGWPHPLLKTPRGNYCHFKEFPRRTKSPLFPLFVYGKPHIFSAEYLEKE